MKIILAQYFEIFQISSSGKIYNKNIFFFFAFLVMKTSEILFFGPSFRQPARKASSGEIYLKNKDLYATDL